MKTMTDAPPKSQADKFRDLARDLEADEDEAAFEEQVKRVAGHSPAKPEKESGPD